jgi:hypothetical protein
MSDNMKDFNECVAKILKYLYSAFPIEKMFDASEMTGEKESEKNELFHGTMIFLKNEDFIRFKDISSYGSYSYMNTVLTAKGLSVLNSSPDSLEKKEPFIEKLKGALKSGSNTAISSVVQGIVQAYLPKSG